MRIEQAQAVLVRQRGVKQSEFARMADILRIDPSISS